MFICKNHNLRWTCFFTCFIWWPLLYIFYWKIPFFITLFCVFPLCSECMTVFVLTKLGKYWLKGCLIFSKQLLEGISNILKWVSENPLIYLLYEKEKFQVLFWICDHCSCHIFFLCQEHWVSWLSVISLHNVSHVLIFWMLSAGKQHLLCLSYCHHLTENLCVSCKC